jgi:thiol-disulfide isomerase/thioredoxin
MNKKIIIIVTTIILAALILITCLILNNEKVGNVGSVKFKVEYESMNNLKSRSNKQYRNLTIDSDNPIIYTTADKVVEKIKNGETFYIYFGSKLCPWCRSVIEKFIEVAKTNNIENVYYVEIWDTDGNEVLRDRYTLEDNNLVKTIDGTSTYYELLDLLENVLPEYTLKDEDGKSISTGEKRIYAPSFIYIENGKAIKLTDGISDKQTSSNDELTEEILEDEEALFNEFFEIN